MSERILKALMQLFAIISRPESDKSERRKVVAGFLRRQLNQQLAQEYIRIFDDYYIQYQEKYKDREKYRKHTSSSSVKLLVICAQINNELTQRQKFTLMVLLLSFIKSGHDECSMVSEFEQDFAETIARALYFDHDEFQEALWFIISPVKSLPASPNLLYIGSKPKNGESCRHLSCEGMADDCLAVLHIHSVDMYICRYSGVRELYLNGQAMNIDDVYALNYGCSIRGTHIRPVYYSDVAGCFYQDILPAPMLFEVQNVEYRFEGGHTGLHPVSFEVLSGNMVGIMGGSGAGKSTLLSVLTGLNVPSAGSVLLNGADIHRQADAVEGLIGYVSQDDVLVEELTVFQNLYFNAKLCFGQDSDEELRNKTLQMLRDLGLYDIRNMKVGTPVKGKISGGQRKRLNIALEVIRQPAVLFLDEPTSGLSSRDSDNIMDLLNELSLKGKLIFVVIHQPSSDIFKMFDRLLLLDQGGYLIYNGNPVDAIAYFRAQTRQAGRHAGECSECGNVNPEQIFNITEARILNEHGQPTDTRRITPAEWYETFTHTPPPATIPPSPTPAQPPPAGMLRRPSRLRQLIIYATRNVLAKTADRQYLAVCLLEAPLLALLLAFIIRSRSSAENIYTLEMNDNLPVYIFVAVIIAIFTGLSVSAEEIIRDRKIIRRESFLNLSRSSYLLSKILVLLAISAIQALLFTIVGNSITGLPITFTFWLVLFSAWVSATLIGLIISDTFRSAVTIYITIPFIVIPQLMLSGVLIPFGKINPDISSPASVPWYGEIITARWAFEALAVEQFTGNPYGKTVYPWEQAMSIADFRRNYWIVEMKNRIARLNDETPPNPALVKLVTEEIERENRRQHHIQFHFRGTAADSTIQQTLLDGATAWLNRLARYYTALYTAAAARRDSIITSFTAAGADSLLVLKSKYYNRSLADMVKNSSETSRIIEHNGRLLQNWHPIYQPPEHPFIRAPFYSPSKMLFGRAYPTLWINVTVIWCFNIIFFIALYFRWIPRIPGIFFRCRRTA